MVESSCGIRNPMRSAVFWAMIARLSAMPKRAVGRFRRGTGVAYAGYQNGFYPRPSNLSVMTIKMNEDGSVCLQTSVHEVGCGFYVGETLVQHSFYLYLFRGKEQSFSPVKP